MTVQLECCNLGFAYQKKPMIEGISLKFHKGECVGLIGPNGAGKSTLLKLLAGLMEPAEGVVKLADQSLKCYSRQKIAQRISLVPQDTAIDYALHVREIVSMGRNPHLGVFQLEGEEDSRLINEAMARTDLLHMADRRVDKLSGGERQRVFIARALAQEAPTLLMDEPTSSLDLCHQLDVLNLVKSLTEDGYLAIAAIHDLDMASRFCDRLVLLSSGRVVADGSPEQVLTEHNLRHYFSVDAKIETGFLDGVGIRVTALKSHHHSVP